MASRKLPFAVAFVGVTLGAAAASSRSTELPDDKENAEGPRPVLSSFLSSLATGKVEEAAAQCTDSLNQRSLAEFARIITNPDLHVAELYSRDSVAHGSTNAFANRDEPETTCHLYVTLRRDGGNWRVERLQIEDAAGLRAIRNEMLQRADLRTPAPEVPDVPCWMIRELFKRLSSKNSDVDGLVSKALDKRALAVFGEFLAGIPIAIREFYLAESRVLAVSQEFPLNAKSKVRGQFAVWARRKGMAWYIDEIQLYDTASVGNARRAILKQFPDARIQIEPPAPRP